VNILLTAKELKRRGHSVALAHGAIGAVDSDWDGVFKTRISLGTPASTEGIASALRQFQPDVVYLNKFSDLAVLQALVNCGRPVVRVVHDHDLYCMRSYKYNYFSRRICTRRASAYCVFPCGAFLGRATGTEFPLRWVSYGAKQSEIAVNKKFYRMLVATEYMRNELLRNGFAPERIEIHSPVPHVNKNPTVPSFNSRNLIVYAGQITRGKGVDVLLESLARVTSPFECMILGDGNHRATCERLSRKLGLDGRVHFKGYVPQSRIMEIYHDASLAVMSSVWPEPFGASGMEAMRCGLPVVAFDAGGIREWLLDGVNGYLAPWMDRDAFAKKVDALLLDKELARRLGKNGQELALERFDFDTYIDRLEKLLVRATSNTADDPALPVGIEL
jgi:glycosyltransferase involved in cell wall biosynthesis